MTRRLVLIDRDGVINEELQDGYVESPEELLIFPQALEALALLHKNGFTCVVVTNQSVVARGRITEAQLKEIHAYLCENVVRSGGLLADVKVCMDHPDAPTFRRKPEPGMLLEALEEYGCAAGATPMIGDAITDMQAAFRAGCKRYLVKTGKGLTTQTLLTEDIHPVRICDDILDAAKQIIASTH